MDSTKEVCACGRKTSEHSLVQMYHPNSSNAARGWGVEYAPHDASDKFVHARDYASHTLVGDRANGLRHLSEQHGINVGDRVPTLDALWIHRKDHEDWHEGGEAHDAT